MTLRFLARVAVACTLLLAPELASFRGTGGRRLRAAEGERAEHFHGPPCQLSPRPCRANLDCCSNRCSSSEHRCAAEHSHPLLGNSSKP